jgi:hypothetical protein
LKYLDLLDFKNKLNINNFIEKKIDFLTAHTRDEEGKK